MQRWRAVVDAHDMRKPGHDLIERGEDRPRAFVVQVRRNASRHHAIHHQTMPEGAAAYIQDALAQDTAMGVVERECRVVADRADVAEMIGDALELGHHPAEHGRARRRGQPECRLDRERERKAVRDRGIAGHSCDDARSAIEICAGQQPVHALVHVAETLLQPNHDLAIGREAEMARLDDAGVHGPDGNLV